VRGVFVWKVQDRLEQEFERRWRAGSEVFQTQPGARGTRLHRSMTDRSLYLGFATWESFTHREAAVPLVNAAQEANPDLRTEDISEAIYVGFFEEPCDEVLPSGMIAGDGER
jgi:heme-degrading monooxygenase HmoA